MRKFCVAVLAFNSTIRSRNAFYYSSFTPNTWPTKHKICVYSTRIAFTVSEIYSYTRSPIQKMLTLVELWSVNISNTVSTNTRISTGQTIYHIGYTGFIEPTYHNSFVKTKLQFHILNMEKTKINISVFVNVSSCNSVYGYQVKWLWYVDTRKYHIWFLMKIIYDRLRVKRAIQSLHISSTSKLLITTAK